MYIQKIKKANNTYYYLCKTIRDAQSKRPKTITVEKLGSHEQLIKKHGKNLDAWLKDYASKKSQAEKSNKQNINILQTKLKKNHINTKNIGYLFIDKLCKNVGLEKICKNIAKKEKLDFNLYKILLAIISRDALDDSVNKNLFTFVQSLYNYNKLKESDVTKTLKIICKYNVYIQKNLYKNASKNYSAIDKCLLYDCSNYGNITNSLEKQKYNKLVSNTVTLGKIFFDSNLIPCGFIVENDTLNLNEDNTEIIKYLKYKFNGSNLYALPGCLESKTDQSIYRRFPNNYQLNFSLAKNYPKDVIASLMSHNDWNKLYSTNKFDLGELSKKLKSFDVSNTEFCEIFGGIYYKNKKYEDKNLFLVFNYEMQYWMREIRDYQLKKFQQTVEDKLAFVNEQNANKIENQHNFLLSDIKDNESKIYFFDDTRFRKDEHFDGYCLLHEDIDIKTLKLVAGALSKKYNEVDYFFDANKTECFQNKNLTLKESILSHFLTSYISYFIVRNFEFALNEKYWDVDIAYQLRNMKVFQVSEDTWIPSYDLTDLLDNLSQKFNFNINYNVLNDKLLNS